jgi:hypothetical protein
LLYIEFHLFMFQMLNFFIILLILIAFNNINSNNL